MGYTDGGREPPPERTHHPRSRPEEDEEADEANRTGRRRDRLDRALDVLLPRGVDGKRLDHPVDDLLADVVVLEHQAEDGDEHDGKRCQREENAIGDAGGVLGAACGEEP
jgi:hypothetical protein